MLQNIWTKQKRIFRAGVFALAALCVVFTQALPASAAQNVQVGAGSGHYLAIKADGTLWTWGDNYYGQLGNGRTGNGADRDKPVKVLENVAAADGGRYHSLALRTDGSVWAWGSNEYGQVGDGTNLDRSQPVKVMEGAKSITAGYYTSAAIKADGTLWTWGNTGLTGAIGNSNRPQKIMDDVADFKAAHGRYYVIRTDGTLWAWGYNREGELGNGRAAEKWNMGEYIDKPFKVMSGVKDVAIGEDHTLAIKKDGTVWAFGSNSAGQLGDGTQTNRLKPVKIMEDAKAVSAGWYNSLILKNDGTLWACGSSRLSQRQRTGADVPTPRVVLSDVSSIASGDTKAVAMKKDGSLWFWHTNAVTGAYGSNAITGEPEQLWRAAK